MGTLHVEVAGEHCIIEVTPDPSPANLRRFEKFVAAESLFGLDVETTALEEEEGGVFSKSAVLRLVQIASRDEAWVIDPSEGIWYLQLQQFFANEAKRCVSHTAYDVQWIAREFGILLTNTDQWIDTFTMAAILYPGHAPKDLKTLSSIHLDNGLKEAEEALYARFKELAPTGFRVGSKCKAWGFTNIALDDPIFSLYAGLDAIYVRRLLDEFATMLRTRKQNTLSFREQRISRLCADMSRRGFLVDQEHAEGVYTDLHAEFQAACQRLEERLEMAPRSPFRGQWLEDHGLVPFERTKTGLVELSKDTLPELVDRYRDDEVLGPVLDDMWTVSQNQNFLTNVSIILAGAHNDGRAHPNIKSQTAVTGRMSITKPAMQTFKKTDPRLRGCFIADPGHTLIGADYNSQEICIAAAFSQDPNLLKIVREGINMHDLTATAIFGPNFTPEQRAKAKVCNLAQQYGIMPKKLALSLGVTVKEATEMWTAWRKTYSGLVRWTDELSRYDTVRNPWGRDIPADRFRRYANGNYAIQSSGRDMLADAMLKLDEEGWGETLWLPVHDELILQVADEDVEDGLVALEQAMECTLKGVHITANAKVLGQRWGADED